jgi:glucose/arabinose dehydrogenase
MPSGGKRVRAVASVAAAIALGLGTLTGGMSSASGAPSAGGAATASSATGPVETSGTPVDIATGLDVPWSILQLHDANNTVLVSERDTGVIERITATGGLDPLATISVHHYSGGEDGLLGLATLVDGGTRWIYAYLTTSSDNRIVRMAYTDPGDPADATLGTAQVILSGLKMGSNHNGGRIAFGPDGMLYATVGDTNRTDTPQNKASLNGKILRMTPTGGVPAGNPFPGSLVYSYGHRNPQGLAWDDDGQLWESELGRNTWDEFNKIVPGGNYGWPIVEGRSSDKRFINPWQQWHTSDASPSGLAYVNGTFFMGSLRGTRLWTIHVDKAAGTARSVAVYVGTLGRIRDVTAGPGGTLWLLTNNTARGTPKPGDDRIVQAALVDSGTVAGTVACATCPLDARVKIDVTLQRLLSGAWVGYGTERVTGGADSGFSFPAVWAGTYRIVTKDSGGGGYLPYIGASFAVAQGEQSDKGTVRIRGSQLDRDLTGDGRNDLLAVDGDTLVRFDGTTPTGFGVQQTVSSAWDASRTAQVGDFDADGVADVVSRDAAGAMWLHLGDGSGGVLAPVQIAPAHAHQTFLVGPGDFNGDGRPDIITGDTSGRMWLWKGNGTAALSAPQQIGTGWTGFIVFPVGDFNGDRKPDLLARTPTGEVRLYPGNGTGRFGSRTRVAANWKVFTALLGPGDVTGDGRADILARAPNGTLRLYPGTGTGKVKPQIVLPGDRNALTFAS